MNHEETSRLLGPYRDGELDLTACLKLEEHLAACPACRQALEEEEALAARVRAEAPRFAAPPFLKTRVQAALRREGGSSRALPWWRLGSPGWAFSGLAGGVVALAVLAVGVMGPQRIPPLVGEAVADHVRSLQVSHLVDVVSSDQHTVKPWFAGKLDYSPQVVDLGAAGYPLIGGRLDVLGHRNVASIVYQRRKHFINLFIWPTEAALPALPIGGAYAENGYRLLGWTRGGMNYLAVSELGEKEMKEFSGLIQEQTLDARPGE